MTGINNTWTEFSNIYKNATPENKKDYREKFSAICSEFTEYLIGEGEEDEGNVDEAETAFAGLKTEE